MIIGPGTGIAPFISFLEERDHQFKQLRNSNSQEIAEKDTEILNTDQSSKNYVFFGNRNSTKDYLLKEFLEGQKDKSMISLYKAFSRDQEDKHYIQHILSEQSAKFGALLKDNLDEIRIYVAGRSKFMPQGVERSLIQCLNTFLNDETKAKERYQKMK